MSKANNPCNLTITILYLKAFFLNILRTISIKTWFGQVIGLYWVSKKKYTCLMSHKKVAIALISEI